jgi:hypothetical protein
MDPTAHTFPRTPGETQPVVCIPAPAKLLVLHGSKVSPAVTRHLNRIVNATSLSRQILNIDEERPGSTARDAVQQLTRNGDAGSHFLLSAHGSVPHMPSGFERKGKHSVDISTSADESASTRYVLDWIVRDLAGSASRGLIAGSSRPFIHLYSCLAGKFREELKPGSALWRNAHVLVYSSKRETSLNACGNAMSTAIRYIDWCEREERQVDPLKLMYLAGLRRGECMTLMGGELSAPLVWHAPKSEADLSDQTSLAMLQGDPKDLARFHALVAELTPAERQLLPAASLRELISNRLVRDDVDSVRALLDRHPELRDAHSTLGQPPLAEAASIHANQCLTLLLEYGANPNASTADGDCSALEMCILEKNLYGLSQLLAWHADPDLASADGLTPLRFAVEENWIEGIQQLLNHQARQDLRLDGETCLEFAVRSGFSDAVECLRSAGGQDQH